MYIKDMVGLYSTATCQNGAGPRGTRSGNGSGSERANGI